MKVSEDMFFNDSNTILKLIYIIKSKHLDIDRLIILGYYIDSMMSSLGLDVMDRVKLYTNNIKNSDYISNNNYREKFKLLYELISNSNQIKKLNGGIYLYELIKQRDKIIRQKSKQIKSLLNSGELCQSLTSLYSSYIHMSCNRMIGINKNEETLVMVLLKNVLLKVINKS